MTLSKRTALFTGYCACVALGSLGILRELVGYSAQNATASHVVLIPFVTLGLVLLDKKAVFSRVRFDWVAGLSVILVGAGSLLASQLGGQSATSGDRLGPPIGAIVVLLIGGFLLCYGRQAARAALFPLLFLGFTIPLPTSLLDGAVQFLQAGSAEAVAGFFAVTGTPFLRQGFVFELPHLAIEIAEECSGIRSSIALLLTSLLVAHVSLRAAWTRTCLVLAIVPIALLKNGIRIVGLTLLSIHVDPGFLTGQLHHEGGIAFFVLALGMLVPVLGLLRHWETARTS